MSRPDASAEADVDLLADDDGDDGEAEGGEAPETSVKPIGPGDDATEEEVANWRAEHGVPDDPTGYEPPQVDGIEWDQEALDPILQIAHEHNLPSKPVADALAAYAKRIQEQRAQIRQRDVENARSVRSAFSEAEIAAVKTAAKAMPAELRTMLNTARLPDGTKLVNQPEVLRLIAAGYGGMLGERQATFQPTDSRTAMQAELRDLDQLMTTDISEYHRPWRGTGLSGSDRRLAIMRELGFDAPAKPSAADLRAEQRELEALRTRDIDMFQFGDWRGSGRPAADRLVALQTGRG